MKIPKFDIIVDFLLKGLLKKKHSSIRKSMDEKIATIDAYNEAIKQCEKDIEDYKTMIKLTNEEFTKLDKILKDLEKIV